MNKELIKKYKAEFDHWLYGGKLQVKFVNDPWEEAPKDIFSYSTVNFVLVVDDEYVEFRKAGAEGKQLQVSYNDGKTWFDKLYRKISWSKTQLVRIKPEEPKIKVGDWVVHPEAEYPWRITQNSLDKLDNTELKLWKPKPGEWCWVYNDTTRVPVLRKFVCMNIRGETDFITAFPYEVENNEVENINDNSTLYYRYIEPFIGELPTILKD